MRCSTHEVVIALARNGIKLASQARLFDCGPLRPLIFLRMHLLCAWPRAWIVPAALVTAMCRSSQVYGTVGLDGSVHGYFNAVSWRVELGFPLWLLKLAGLVYLQGSIHG
jgi:hypothetical protein